MSKDRDTPRRTGASGILRIDALCDRYEDEWRAGRVPDLAAHLAEVDAADRPALHHALLNLDAVYRGSVEELAAPDPDAVPLKLVVTAGPHTGEEFAFEGHDTFLVGRSSTAHFRLSYDDPYFSRRHFLVEVNPPRIRAFDLNSRNGIYVNGVKVRATDLNDGDELRAGHTVFRVTLPRAADPDQVPTLGLSAPPPAAPAKPALAARVDDDCGERVPGYRLEKVIGRGAMGTVYRACRVADGARVAVKLISLLEGVTARHIDRFLREAKILASLDHRNIVRYLDSGQSEGEVYLVMELVDGPDAAKVVKRGGALDVPTATRVTVQAIDGLAHAHASGFVHRDVKPANLLLGREKGKRVVKLADFGLARCYEASGMSGRTLHGEIGGTPAFMAPEQVTHYRDVQPAADQYGAAASLYYLLTGRYVLDFAADAGDHLVQIITEPRVPIRTRRPATPAGLAAVLDRALASEPGDRFPDLAAFRDALKPFVK